jgi:hypothetical protein
MYKSTSAIAYAHLRGSEKRVWSVPVSETSPERTEPAFGGARIFGTEVCEGLQFTPRFQLTRDARICTIGSCFARNVEEALLQQGFNVLTRQGDFPYSHGCLNRYNTPVMAQEIDFATGSRQFEERSISSMDADGFADLTSYGHFDSPAEAMDLRRYTTNLFRAIGLADVVVITAGLSEVWYDREFDYYTNIAPSRAALVYPDRYEFRLLSFLENFDELSHLVEKIRSIKSDCKILMTVSPVPLNATFVERDVLISNSYSKACLRAAVEQIQWEYPYVDYFPSFEMTNLSAPEIVWESDRRHVKQSFVNAIMSEFVKRCVDG